jgi:hypothetical protein
VTSELHAWIGAQPDHSTLRFPAGACYRVDGTLRIYHRNGLTLDGNGATIRAFTQGDRARRHLRLVGGSDLLVRDLVVHGANPNAGTGDEAFDRDFEAQHGIEIDGVQGATLDGVRVTDVWGDFVYIGAEHAKTGWIPSRHVVVKNSHFERNGRQGITPNFCEDVLITNNYIGEVRRATFDLEPPAPSWWIRDVRIIGNTTGDGRLMWLASGGDPGATIQDIYIADNTMLPGSNTGGIVRMGRLDAPNLRGPIVIENNHFVAAHTPWGALAFLRVRGITVRGNTFEVSNWGDMPLVTLQDAHDATTSGNVARGVSRIYEADGLSSNYQHSQNIT